MQQNLITLAEIRRKWSQNTASEVVMGPHVSRSEVVMGPHVSRSEVVMGPHVSRSEAVLQ